ncbi:MerR family transcriptional regulator [Goodfellowiella coeruleoviolacea]|uniref:MerR family transcriptional regulator, heat shock protein HspR n=1 Tax=Goodfellowiella coeruleoviolacea TaxID=334858 RepID=A0AAE3KI48_9PSEU|nr:MerR family transcriptional regulator [Goodfellowiella coeruleoviolacea]MCP2167059.1 MerR family transcriptional regulator, heat shock protein HspR [Goodfellowiella coeruleoviolacea]
MPVPPPAQPPAPRREPGELYPIAKAAQAVGIHPQTLRGYERSGLIQPYRVPGGQRRYSRADLDRLRLIRELSVREGINVPGIRRILELLDTIAVLRQRLNQVQARLRGLGERPTGRCGGDTVTP